jgi:hypothetical protein
MNFLRLPVNQWERGRLDLRLAGTRGVPRSKDRQVEAYAVARLQSSADGEGAICNEHLCRAAAAFLFAASLRGGPYIYDSQRYNLRNN